ncbi:hypothetical protein N0V85_005574 [Neurospora sp. IMI 360204]|nr:hypothetical protein N0V85_005574 [Neurospora sp. IMI 360204]
MSLPTPLEPIIHPLFDPPTSTFTYLVACPSTLSAIIIIDSVLDFDPATSRISTTTTADSLLTLHPLPKLPTKSDGDTTQSKPLFSLPAHYKIYTGHDYPSADSRSPQPYTTVTDQKRLNKHLKDGTTKEQFVNWRQERDSGLAEPKLLHQALQVSVRAGRMPRDGMLKVPFKMPGGRVEVVKR